MPSDDRDIGEREYNRALLAHYERVWNAPSKVNTLDTGRMRERFEHFCVLSFEPREGRKLHTYATVGMSAGPGPGGLELHLHAPVADERLTELLYVICAHHRSEAILDLHHIVRFGKYSVNPYPESCRTWGRRGQVSSCHHCFSRTTK